MFGRRNGPLIARALLALGLLVAQSGAQAHLYSHRLTDLSGAPTTQLCSECLCFAPVLAAAGASPHTLFIPHAVGERIDAPAHATTPVARAFSAFQSRAPPASL